MIILLALIMTIIDAGIMVMYLISGAKLCLAKIEIPNGIIRIISSLIYLIALYYKVITLEYEGIATTLLILIIPLILVIYYRIQNSQELER